MRTILITLTAQTIGEDATEDDFDSWVNWITENLSVCHGIPVDVDSHDFNNGPAEDTIDISGKYNNNEEIITTVREAIEECWGNWCES